jgi:hypothetical protein
LIASRDGDAALGSPHPLRKTRKRRIFTAHRTGLHFSGLSGFSGTISMVIPAGMVMLRLDHRIPSEKPEKGGY